MPAKSKGSLPISSTLNTLPKKSVARTWSAGRSSRSSRNAGVLPTRRGVAAPSSAASVMFESGPMPSATLSTACVHRSMVATPMYRSCPKLYEFSPLAELAAPTTPSVWNLVSSVAAWHVSTRKSISLSRPCVRICATAAAKSCADPSVLSRNLRNSSPPWPDRKTSTFERSSVSSILDRGVPGGCRPVSTLRKASEVAS
mmetsp:Transcript_7573/g.23051  ORF Transcript_7573/g.23051 Transcript_7573/m.23051 type:complete len:200 (-) Transcript_7573:43-642(-)